MENKYDEFNFTGELTYKVDGKGRVVNPLIDAKGEEQYVFLLINAVKEQRSRCVFCMSPEQFAAYYKRLCNVPTDSDAYALVKHILSSVAKVKADNQGKIIVPKALKEYAAITDEVTFCNTRTALEMWSPERLREKREADLANEAAYKAFEIYMLEGLDITDPDSVARTKQRLQDEISLRSDIDARNGIIKKDEEL